MNKYQEAFIIIANETLVDCPDYKIIGNGCSCKEQHKCRNKLAVDLIKELVDKATPKFVTCKSGWQGTRYTRYRCPNCNKTLEFAEYPYCKHCGQAVKYPKLKKVDNKIELDWSEE